MQQTVPNTMDSIATNVTYGASASAVFFGLNVDQWGIIGVIVAITMGVFTLGFNIWFKMKYHRN